MSPVTRGPMGRLTSGLRPVSRKQSHFRSGRWLLLADAALLIALGAAGLVSAASHRHAPPTGAPVLGLALTPWHSTLLLGLGVLAAVGVVGRHAAVAAAALCTVVFAALVIIGAIAAAHHAPGPLGFEPRDIVLHGVLAVTSFAVLYWLLPDVLEGPDWVRRKETGRAGRYHREQTQNRPISP
ncbi:hypothetical protein A5676_21365 [Mycobacterium malmoense]|uniref:DUF4383 domain-containing protein n=1 Tax=Mycobacterium malmoense TaxID=1780 RepID=UPI00080B0749|nr:DUF4383 domain-containing protein [Mycobacterium malmoense]OCB36413.1 hypothetical protein A5676_21365 [Mycobacterium malmoense]